MINLGKFHSPWRCHVMFLFLLSTVQVLYLYRLLHLLLYKTWKINTYNKVNCTTITVELCAGERNCGWVWRWNKKYASNLYQKLMLQRILAYTLYKIKQKCKVIPVLNYLSTTLRCSSTIFDLSTRWRWAGPKTSLDTVEQIKLFTPARNQTPAIQPVACCYIDLAT
jgi:hypothetical protein